MFAGFRWPPILFFLIGTAIIVVGPYFYYTHFSERAERVYNPERESLDWRETGIFWVGPYNEGRTWSDLLRYTGTAFLYSWEWPKPVEEPGISVRTLKLLKGAAIGLGIVLALGMFPWRSLRGREDELSRPRPRVLPALWLAVWTFCRPTSATASPKTRAVADRLAG
jgi:hypothetical protein